MISGDINDEVGVIGVVNCVRTENQLQEKGKRDVGEADIGGKNNDDDENNEKSSHCFPACSSTCTAPDHS